MMKKRYPTCIFCQRNDSEPSKEDVIPKWIARSFPGEKKAKFTSLTGAFPGAESPEMEFGAVGKFGWEIAGPCTRCNNTWMSDLENAAKPIMLPLMRGEASMVDATQLIVLARWTLKTTMMYEFLRYESGRYFTKRNRFDFFKSRTIPPHTFMYAARYLGSSAHYSIGGPMLISFPATTTQVPGYSAATAVGELALQVLTFKPPDRVDPGLRVNIPKRSDAVHKPVWPIGLGWSWPPAVALDDEGFKRFATRTVDQLLAPSETSAE
jgi:hypothetical protein